MTDARSKIAPEEFAGRRERAAGMALCLERKIRKDGYLGDFEETVVVTKEGCEKITDAKVRWW